jgi:hypothetical protein
MVRVLLLLLAFVGFIASFVLVVLKDDNRGNFTLGCAWTCMLLFWLTIWMGG